MLKPAKATAPARRGRPLGSKNKNKMPREVSEAVTTAQMATKTKRKRGGKKKAEDEDEEDDAGGRGVVYVLNLY